MMKADCHNCGAHTLCSNVLDVGWICADCRSLWAPPDHVLAQHYDLVRARTGHAYFAQIWLDNRSSPIGTIQEVRGWARARGATIEHREFAVPFTRSPQYQPKESLMP